MAHIVDEYSQTIGRENVEIYPIGRKVYEKAQKMGLNVQGEYSALADKPTSINTMKGRIANCFIAYLIY